MATHTHVRTGLSRLAMLAVAVVGAVAFIGCTTNEATGKRIITFMSMDQELALGAEAAPQFTAEYGGQVPDEKLQQYVTNIGNSMAVYAEGGYDEIPWTFTLLNSPVINAFALPGGKVFFSRGLAEKLDSEAEMAGVIGHEIGHVTAQHGNQRMSSSTLLQALVMGAVVVAGTADEGSDLHRAAQVGVPALSVGGQLVLLKFGRDEELEADRLGVRYMTKAGYNPLGQLRVMQILKAASSGGRQPDILSTHPNPDDRIAQIQYLLENDYAFTQNDPQFQLFEQRYDNQFLNRVKQLPPPPKPQANGRRGVMTPYWCLNCQQTFKSNAKRRKPVARGQVQILSP
ncbi:MAG: M48 family metalloprotease [Phycisphaeraceae bacterium]|nr:M48 family metalloprotease [Phycisphaerales bacterium]MCB9861462.1 M48 family metalloprotease [Phycisphaeraceae bacterium]